MEGFNGHNKNLSGWNTITLYSSRLNICQCFIIMYGIFL